MDSGVEEAGRRGRQDASKSYVWVFVVWLATFYAAWLALVAVGGQWKVVADHWPIATAMAAGSYFAGSTPMGGGTVGFPVLVLLFDMPSSIGRNFSFAVQSVGMVSAAIFIFATRRPLAWPILRWAIAATSVATPLAAAFVAPSLPSTFVALLFGVIWCSFGMLHFLRLGDIVGATGLPEEDAQLDRVVGITIGTAGGIASAATGVGIDMLLYTGLVALLRVDIKVAIPTSVVVMAYTSVVGLMANLALGTVSEEVFHHWLAAAPVVALGAPFGALIVEYLSRTRTLLIVSALCVFQFGWTLIDKEITGMPLLLSFLGVAGTTSALLWLYAWGDRRNGAVRLTEGPGESASVGRS